MATAYIIVKLRGDVLSQGHRPGLVTSSGTVSNFDLDWRHMVGSVVGGGTGCDVECLRLYCSPYRAGTCSELCRALW